MRRTHVRLVSLAATTAAILAGTAPGATRPAAAAEAPAVQTLPPGTIQETSRLVHQATTILATAGDAPATASDESPAVWGAGQPPPTFDSSDAPTRLPAAGLPHVGATSVSEAPSGFDGISELDQKLADGGHQPLGYWSTMALCASDRYVLEAISHAIRVFDPQGKALTPAVALGPFLGDGHEQLSADPLTSGAWRHSHNRCAYDWDVHRFFVLTQRFHVDDATFAYTGRSYLELAVSRSADPRAAWDIYTVDATADGSEGTAALGRCPCATEGSSLGTDANGVYIGTNLVQQNGSGFRTEGYRILALSKQRLVSGHATTAMSLTVPTPADPSADAPSAELVKSLGTTDPRKLLT